MLEANLMRSNLLLQLQAGIQHQQAMQVLPIVWRAHRVLQGFCYVGETHYNFAVHKIITEKFPNNKHIKVISITFTKKVLFDIFVTG
jgi:hypothetical protein